MVDTVPDVDSALAGAVDATDPRESYDDLLVEREIEELDADAFERARALEPLRAGWVAVGAVLDADGRALLAYHEGDERWLLPGGAVQPGESLEEGLVREVREETGVRVRPVRAHAIVEHVVRHDAALDGFRAVFFEARPETTRTGCDLGVDGEPIADAGWFESLPEETFQRRLASRVLDRVTVE